MRRLCLVALTTVGCGRVGFDAHADLDAAGDAIDGPSTAPRLASGMYMGNGNDPRSITIGFQPAVVLVKRDSNGVWGRIRTSSMTGDQTKLFESSIGSGAIRSIDASGFTVSSDTGVNESGGTYYWIAFADAPSELALGAYTGDGADDRAFSVGFTPVLVMTMPQDVGLPLMRSSTMPADSCHDVDATEHVNAIQRMLPAGFEIGSDALVNGAGKRYHYIAWAAVPGKTAAGMYTGDGAASRAIDDAGFMPDWLLVKRVTNAGVVRPWVHRPAVITGDLSLFLADFAGISDAIPSVRPLGFEIGNQPQTNEAGMTYHWVAFRN